MSASRRHDRRGQALLEFALVLPVFTVLLFGVVDAGRLLYMNSVLSQAAREGARVAAVEAYWVGSSDPSCGTAGGPVCPASVRGSSSLLTDVTAGANRMVAPFGQVSNVYLSCDAPGGAPSSASWTGTTCSQRTPGNVASVRVVLTFTPFTPVIGSIIGTVTLSGSATMVIN